MTKVILSVGFSVLLGSFVFYGEDLKQVRELASVQKQNAGESKSRSKDQEQTASLCGDSAKDSAQGHLKSKSTIKNCNSK